MKCPQPGCGGTIQDGYCDTCGMAPAAPASGPASSGSSASAPLRPPGLLLRPAGAEVAAGLPLVDRGDPAAGYLATFAGLSSAQRVAALAVAVAGDPSVPQQVTESAETRLALVRARIDAGGFGLERSYRALARLTPDEDRRIELVDMANAIRPRTLT